MYLNKEHLLSLCSYQGADGSAAGLRALERAPGAQACQSLKAEQWKPVDDHGM
jgi:hypothetical protein